MKLLRPETRWLDRCSAAVRRGMRVGADGARRICAANWHRRMSQAAKLAARRKYAPKRR